MIDDVNGENILSEAIACLDQESIDGSLLQKKLPLLSFFAQEIIDSDKLDEECDAWLENLAFGFCMKYFEIYDSGRNKLLDKECYKLLIVSCKRKHISVQLLKRCIALIDFNKNNRNKTTDDGNDDEPRKLSLDCVVRVIQGVVSSWGDEVFGVEQEVVKQDIIVSVIHLLKCEDITDLYFTRVCCLLKDLVNSSVEKEIEHIWSTISHLYGQSKYERVMLIISIVLQVIKDSYIVKKTVFWIILQCGLVYPDPLTRKRALFIIKWLLDHISKGDKFSTDSTDDDDNGVILSWCKVRDEKTWDIWKTVILLLETLDEKQMHVINPVLPLIDDVFSASVTNGLLHFSWLLVILRRSLNHESKLLNKWALQYCLTMKLEKHLVASQRSLQFIFVDLMKSLQLIYVYNREEGTPCGGTPLILDLLAEFITNCLNHLGDKQSQFVNMILDAFQGSSFNDISLVYLTEVLSRQALSASLSNIEASKFKQFCFSKISIYRIEYQKVIFHNLSVFFTKHILPENPIVSDVINILAYAIDRGFFVLNGNCWIIWLTWLNNMPDRCKEEVFTSKIQDYLHNSVTLMKSSNSLNATGFSILVMFQCRICPRNDIRILLHGLSDVIGKLHSNPYLDSKKVFKVLELTSALFKTSMQYDPSVVSHIFTFFISSLPNICQHLIYISEHLHENNELFETLPQCLYLLQNYIKVSLCIEYGEMIGIELQKFFSKTYIKILENLNSILHTLENNENYSDLLHKLFSIKLLKCYLGWKDAKIEDPFVLCKLLVDLAIKCDRQMLSTVCKKSEVFEYVNCDLFLSDIWCSLTLLIEKHIPSGVDRIMEKRLLLETFVSDMTIVSHEHILDVTQFARSFIPMFVDDTEELIYIVDYMWKIVREQSQTDHSFWKIYICCVRCMFHEELLFSTNEDVIDKLKEIWGYVLNEGERKVNVINILITHCVEIWSKRDDRSTTLSFYTDQFIATSMFGPLLNKCTKPMDDLIFYLHSSGIHDGISELKSAHYANEEVRVTMINFLLNLKDDSSLSNFFDQLKYNLLDMASKLAKSRKCYYPNTLIHRKILRIWQLFLILLSKHPSTFDYELILPQLFLAVKTAHQTSIRYLIEWCILLIVQHDNRHLETLLDEMDKGSEKQILSVTSMMSLCIHLAGLLKGKYFEMFVKKAVPKALPWCHAQHMTSRVYAQVVLESIWENILENNCCSLKDEFHFLSYCFTLKVDNSAAVKNRIELKKHFFYSQFHPIRHYTLETVFHKFPAHSDILADEWITVDKFEYYEGSVGSAFGLKLQNVIEFSMPSKLDGNEYDNLSNCVDEKLVDIQKKIMPWRVLPPTDVVLQSELEKKNESKSSQLILCAVLVDKIPNLGGLCRTAEIFGVASFIVGSHRYVEDQGFKSLSVSAERWLNIEQVLPIKLASYLKEMRSDGYQIVGVEQTANSKMIGQYNFPEKTVLVLGNEKTGIPVELIQLLDECVEIPQVGIIRSLNVHISGAIMVWEYCKQHMLDICK